VYGDGLGAYRLLVGLGLTTVLKRKQKKKFRKRITNIPDRQKAL
jgi:hypothetical protein